MTDVDAMRAAVLRDPADDVARLALADALDDRGEPGDAARAEFVRVQIALAKLPPKRRELFVADGAGTRLEGLGVALAPRGDGHYSASNAERGLSLDDFAPNERIDVYAHLARKNRVGWMRGLKYVRTVESRNEIIFRKDAESGPWPGAELEARERAILDDPHPVGDYRIYSNRLGWAEDIRQHCKYEFARGFVSRIELPCEVFAERAKHLFAAHPITAVVLADFVPCTGGMASPESPAVRINNTESFQFGGGVPYFPKSFGEHLKGGLRAGMSYGDRRYESRAEAGAAANAMALSWGRERAGLPPLPIVQPVATAGLESHRTPQVARGRCAGRMALTGSLWQEGASGHIASSSEISSSGSPSRIACSRSAASCSRRSCRASLALASRSAVTRSPNRFAPGSSGRRRSFRWCGGTRT